jgi:hypothetical protein
MSPRKYAQKAKLNHQGVALAKVMLTSTHHQIGFHHELQELMETWQTTLHPPTCPSHAGSPSKMRIKILAKTDFRQHTIATNKDEEHQDSSRKCTETQTEASTKAKRRSGTASGRKAPKKKTTPK